MSSTATRAFAIIKELVTAGVPLGVMDIARRLGYDKSTTSRVMKALEEEQYVYREPRFKGYAVGPAMLALATAVTKRSALLQLVRPYLTRLSEQSGETVSFYIRVGDGRVCVDGIEGSKGRVRMLPVGEAIPLHTGTSAKAILAHLAQEEASAILDRLMLNGSARADLLAELDVIRERGYAAAFGERTPGVVTLSCPVFDASAPFAAITFSAPEDRWSRDQVVEFADSQLRVADEVTQLVQAANLR